MGGYRATYRPCICRSRQVQYKHNQLFKLMVTLITRVGGGREDKGEDRRATRSEKRGGEWSASSALMHQGGEEGCGGICGVL